LKCAKRRVAAVARDEVVVDKLGRGQVQVFFADFGARVLKQVVGLVAEQANDTVGCHEETL
jgi:hypothetical protein